MATIYRRGTRWHIQWREGGELRRRSLGNCTKQDAEAILAAKELELKSGITVYRLGGDSFTLFAREYLDWHKHEYPDSHDRIYQIVTQHLIPFFSVAQIGKIEVQHAEKYKRTRAQQAKPETVNKELRTLHAILNKAVEWGRIDRNPIKAVKAIRKVESAPPRFYTAAELDRIYSADPLHASIWRLLANTGMRRSEAFALKWENVTETSIKILSSSKNRTKSGRWREVPLSPGAKFAIDDLRRHCTTDYVIDRMHPASLSRAFDKAIYRIGLPGSLHCLRHTFCSHLVMSGVPLRTVQVLAGHASFKTTEIYAHLSPDHLADSVSRLNL